MKTNRMNPRYKFIRFPFKKFAVLLAALILTTNCSKQSAKPLIAVSSQPVAEIVGKIVGAKAEVAVLVPPGVSPHTWTPKPSDIYKIKSATALIYVSDNLDAWSAQIAGEKKIELIDFVPEEMKIYFDDIDTFSLPDSLQTDSDSAGHHHDHAIHEEEVSNRAEHDHSQHGHDHSGGVDPHFWTSPRTVKAILPALADTLGKLDPENASAYANSADIFAGQLDLLDRKIESILAPVRGRLVFLHHPSMLYLLRDYGLIYAGSVEVAPEKEALPRELYELIEKIKASGVKSIFTEPQIPRETVDKIAREAGVAVYELDPLGSSEENSRYSDMVIKNAQILSRALR